MERYYRYIDSYPIYESEASHIYCRDFCVVKRTEKGAWIKEGSFGRERFILDRAKKKFAYPTREGAFMSFAIRKRRHMQHVKYTHDHLVNILKLIDAAEQSEGPIIEYIENNNTAPSIFDLKLPDVREKP